RGAGGVELVAEPGDLVVVVAEAGGGCGERKEGVYGRHGGAPPAVAAACLAWPPGGGVRGSHARHAALSNGARKAEPTDDSDQQRRPLNEQNEGTVVAPESRPANGMAVAGLVVGIVSAVLAFIPFVALVVLPSALVGLSLACIGFWGARVAHVGRGQAIAGIALNAVALLLLLGWLVLWAASVLAAVRHQERG